MTDPRSTPAVADDLRYWAFISYSHHDSERATRLHRAIEGYSVPSRLVGRASGQFRIPRRLRPIFFDTSELSVARELTSVIREALAHSRCLIVICSPEAARSVWVDKEIVEFLQLHPGGRVLPILIAGEPNAARLFGDDTTECLPPSLRKEWEPLAADARGSRDEQQDAKLKLVSSILDIPFDELKQRHTQQRIRLLIIASLAAIGVAAVMAVLAIVALRSRDEAREQSDLAIRAKAQAEHERTEASKARDHAVAERERAEASEETARLEQGRAEQATGEAVRARNRAERETQRVDSLRVAAEARLLFPRMPQRGLLLAVHAMESAVRSNEPLLGIEQTLRDLVHRSLGDALDRLPSEIRFVAICSSSNQLVAAGLDGSLRAWDISVAPPRLLGTRTVKSVPTALATHERSGSLGLAAFDGTITRCSLIQGQLPTCREMGSQRSPVQTLSFSPSGEELLSGGEDGRVLTWRTGSDIATELGKHKRSVVAAAFTPDHRWLATGSEDRTVAVWDLSGQGQDQVLKHVGAVHTLQFTPNGRHLITGSVDGSIRIWDIAAKTRSEPRMLASSGPAVTRLALSNDGKKLLSVTADGKAQVRQLDGPAPHRLTSLSGHRGAITGATISSDGSWALTSGEDATVRLWPLGSSDPAPASQMFYGHEGPIRTLAVAGHDAWLATGGADGIPRLSRLLSHGLARSAWGELTLPESPRRLEIGPRSDWLVAYGGADHAYAVANPYPTGARAITIPNEEGWEHYAALEPKGSSVAVVGKSSMLVYWKLVAKRAEPLGTCDMDLEVEGVVQIAAIGRLEDDVIVATSDGQIFACPFASGSQRALAVARSARPIQAMSVSKKGRFAVTFNEKQATFWRFPKGQAVSSVDLSGYGGDLGPAAAIANNGRWLAARPSYEDALVLWRIDGLLGRTAPAKLPSKGRWPGTFAFDEQGTTLAEGQSGGGVRLWKLDQMSTPVDILQRSSSDLVRLDLGDRGAQLIAAYADGEIRLWSLAMAGGGQDSVVVRPAGIALADFVVSPDRHWIHVLAADGVLERYPLSREQVLSRARRIPGRGMTPDEQKELFANRAPSNRGSKDAPGESHAQ